MKFGYMLLYVKDVRRTVEFYETAFGLERGFFSEEGAAQYAEMKTGETKLGFVSFELAKLGGLPVADSQPEGKSAPAEIALVTDDVESAFDRAVAAGAEALVKPERKPWGQTVGYVRDIDSFLIEICTPMA